MDLVLFTGFFFLTVLLVCVIYLATTVVPAVRTLGVEKKAEEPIEYAYNNQFGPLLGWRMKAFDWNPESTSTHPTDGVYSSRRRQEIQDASGNFI